MSKETPTPRQWCEFAIAIILVAILGYFVGLIGEHVFHWTPQISYFASCITFFVTVICVPYILNKLWEPPKRKQ
jgi:hypothetical protein